MRDPTAAELAVVGRVSRKLARHMPQTGVMDAEDVECFAREALVEVLAEGRKLTDELLGATIRMRTIDLLRQHGVLRRETQKDGSVVRVEKERATLDSLEPRVREIVEARVIHEEPVPEIAERLGITVTSVYFRKAKAMRQLRGDLSIREVECLQCAADGLTNDQTAEVLGLAMETVKQYRKSAIRTLGAKNTTNAVMIAFSRGVLV